MQHAGVEDEAAPREEESVEAPTVTSFSETQLEKEAEAAAAAEAEAAAAVPAPNPALALVSQVLALLRALVLAVVGLVRSLLTPGDVSFD